MTDATHVVIVGGGLSGLAAARALQAAGVASTVLESRARPGGRILSQGSPAGGRYDLGPAWIWPHNHRMRALARELNVPVFAQHSRGRFVFQDGSGAVRNDLEFAPMADALRLAGGIGAIVDAIAARLASQCLRLGYDVREVRSGPAGLTASGIANERPFDVAGTHVVLALPPRLLARKIAFHPEPRRQALAALADTPTWMAGQAKVVAVYDRPFWRDLGLSGDAISHAGPLMEIHDASTADGYPGALFGFVSPGTAVDPDVLRKRAVRQLGALFGPDAENPVDVLIKDWASDPWTATEADRVPLRAHPQYGLSPEQTLDGAGRILLAGSETAHVDGGFLEGALVAAEEAVARVLASTGRTDRARRQV